MTPGVTQRASTGPHTASILNPNVALFIVAIYRGSRLPAL